MVVSTTPTAAGHTRESRYLTMRDGVRIAIDLHRPRIGGRVPTVIRATRYWRRHPEPTDPVARARWIDQAQVLTDAGSAYVTVDVRGTGASFGAWRAPWAPDEVADLGEVAAWITAQPWSNGSVGAFGVSYDGNTAELLAATGEPCVRAVVPRFSDVEPFEHLSFPGGILLDGFLREWAAMNLAMDVNDVRAIRGLSDEEYAGLEEQLGTLAGVDGDEDGRLLAAAVAEHSDNVDVHAVGASLTYRDDEAARSLLIDEISPMARRREIEASGAAIFAWASWFDAGTALGAIERFRNFSNPQRVLIGPWSHGAGFHASPFSDPGRPAELGVEQQYALITDFLRDNLTDAGRATIGRTLRYYTLGAEEWRETDVWPPRGTTTIRWYLREGGRLERAAPVGDGADHYEADFSASTGATTNRWQTQLGGGPVVYGDRRDEDRKLLTYDTPPLEHDLEATGSPVVTLHVRSTHEDGAFYAYLEDVAPDGTVTYVTEGQLRALHRCTAPAPEDLVAEGPYRTFRQADAAPLVPGEPAELTFALLPTSVRFAAGHRIRLAIAAHDAGTFVRIPAEGTPVVTVDRSVQRPSHIELPAFG
ncbi:MAG TPA: CocE/NonD family hydrolase [Nitriliruptorales bacterium]